MKRKQDQAISTKVTKASAGKPMEQGRIRKQQYSKPSATGIESVRHGSLKSKAGFTLYSEKSDTTKPTRPETTKSLISTNEQQQDEKKIEEQFMQQAEVVSQMQLQTEIGRAELVAAIVIPTVDFEIHGDTTLYGNCDQQEFGTPFNKRLVSSTPDPERLLEAELMEHHANQPSIMCPQMIPERDTTHPTKASGILTSVSGSLSKKLKAQRQYFHKNQQSLQKQQNQQSLQMQQNQQTQWQQHLQQYQSNTVQHNSLKDPALQSLIPNNELLTLASSPVRVTKAEWSVGGYQDAMKDDTASTIVHSMKSSNDYPSLSLQSSSVHRRFHATFLNAVTNSDVAGNNSNAQINVSRQMAPLDMLILDSDNKPHSPQTSEDAQSIKPWLHMTDGDHDTSSFLKHQSLKYETVQDKPSRNISMPNKPSGNINTRGQLERPTKKAVVSEKQGSAFSKPETSTGANSHLTSTGANNHLTSTGANNHLTSTGANNHLTSTGANSHLTSTSNLPYTKKTIFPDPSTSKDENTLYKLDIAEWTAKTELPRIVNTCNNPPGQDKVKSELSKNMKKQKANANLKEIVKDPSIENTDSLIKTKLYLGETKRVEDLEVSPVKHQMQKTNDCPANYDLDTSSDTCDMEVTSVLYEHKNNDNADIREAISKLNEKIYNKSEQDIARLSSASVSSNLSEVIEFLKCSAFNKAKECNSDGWGISTDEVKGFEGDGGTVRREEAKEWESDDRRVRAEKGKGYEGDDMKFSGEASFSIDREDNNDKGKQLSGDKEILAELMRQYLPGTDNNNINNNSNKCVDNGLDNDEDGSCAVADVEVNVNQNHLSDEEHDYEMHTSKRPPRKNLQYLERMADPVLRDIACRLTLKATALRDVELRDLVDDMIFHTDAALGREDARLQSSQMFFIEENNKLKRRVQSINQQLDAKERQERMGANNLGLSNNDVLHLERKIMYLSQEKEKLDNQVTALLEEKAKWLMTQQDLVRTISLKNHEILKLEEKHHEEKKPLLQSLDQATKNSQGVHYKLSVADREISNLEQCVRSRNTEIMNLKESLKEAERKLMDCERHSKLKDQEMLRLQDLVDALKIGVDHVLQAYESSSSKGATTGNQRQGIENLRQMVHPEEYSLSRLVLSDSEKTPAAERRIQGPHDYRRSVSSSRRSPHCRENNKGEPSVRLQHQHISLSSGQAHQRHRSVEDTSFREAHQSQQKSGKDNHRRSRKDGGQEKLPRRLTPRTLEEHNRCLTPVDRTLWRSLDNEPRVSQILGEDPYYSDSEIEIHGHRRRRSSHRFSRPVDYLQQRSSVFHSSLPHSPATERTEQHPGTHDGNGRNEFRNSQDTKYSTLRSETIPKSLDSHEVSNKDLFSEETYYSSLRSEPLNEMVSGQNLQRSVHYTSEPTSHRHNLLLQDQHQVESRQDSILIHDDAEVDLVRGEYHPTSLSVSYPTAGHNKIHSISQRNVQQHSLGHEYQHAGVSSRSLNDQEMSFATLRPEGVSLDTHRTSHHHLGALSQADIEAGTSDDFDKHKHRIFPPHVDGPFNSTTQPRHELHSRSADNEGLISYSSEPQFDHGHQRNHPEDTHFIDVVGHPSQSRHSARLSGMSNYLTHINDISVSRRATRDSDNVTQREFFQGTELSASWSSISDADVQSSNNNQLRNINENPFSSGIASLDEKIANLQRKIDRTKAMFS